MIKNYKIYLDDERIPKSDGWMVIRNIDEFKQLIELMNGLPREISFDHDLGQGEGKDAIDLVKWMVNEKQFDMRKIEINVHSANPVGRDNILGLIKSWNKFLDENSDTIPTT